LDPLVEACEEFERRIDDLRSFKREYRGRMRLYFLGQLDQLGQEEGGL
jgi:hypothetical protein